MPIRDNVNLSDNNVHFTYKEKLDKGNLCQGDLLKITDELKGVLEQIHPYFLKEQYKYFMVLTQSCDLVRRKGAKCKTQYITLAAVREFDSLFEKLLVLGKIAETKSGILFMDEKNGERAYQLLERLYNNTESDYFFLYKDDVLSFSKSMVACLKVSIALKSDLHYEKCLKAKVLELSDEFKAKLGWLVGNMYSRVGTADWETIMTEQQRKDMLREELRNRCIVGHKSQIKELKKYLDENQEVSSDDAMEYMSTLPVITQYDKVMNEIEMVVGSMSKKLSEETRTNLMNAIKSKATIKSLLSK